MAAKSVEYKRRGYTIVVKFEAAGDSGGDAPDSNIIAKTAIYELEISSAATQLFLIRLAICSRLAQEWSRQRKASDKC